MDLIQFDHITLSKLHPFKNIEGDYCFINYQDKLIINIPETEVVYDSNGSYVLLSIKGTTIFTFMEQLKETLINQVYEKHIYSNTPVKTLFEFYVSPHKISKNGKNILKCKCSEIFEKNTKINAKIHVSGMWFSKTSFGPYFLIHHVEKIPNVCLITDSDSDTEINI
jgi:hypothetical protein